MANSFISMNIHYVFSTKNREKFIEKELQQRLWPYMGGIAKQNNIIAHSIGGTEDHAHLLLSLPGSISPSKAIQLIKSGSSKWIHESFPDKSGFYWQTGYAAFSVSISNIDRIIKYIQNQEKHHKTVTFQQEYLAFLKNSGIDYDERHIWG
ncbi:MAG: IS200/IS605 family transposase [Bacteroidales bacterium]|nr:IS200/IS605 family transposase [Bacteroidales bacterium]